MPSDIVILDVETLGLHPDAPIWEFAAVRRFTAGCEDKAEFQIRHDPGQWIAQMMETPRGEQFVADYTRRYNKDDAVTESDAAVMMHAMTRAAVVVGCNPSFDLERITKLIIKHGMAPEWHYRPLCVTTMAAGYLHGAAQQAEALRSLPLPWSSDELSRGIGVDPDDYPRHTAIGDVMWAAAQWDAITGLVGWLNQSALDFGGAS